MSGSTRHGTSGDCPNGTRYRRTANGQQLKCASSSPLGHRVNMGRCRGRCRLTMANLSSCPRGTSLCESSNSMLTAIKKIKGFGVFDDFSAPSDLPEFKRFNLIYGENGSGKTTLSRLFAALELGGDAEHPDL